MISIIVNNNLHFFEVSFCQNNKETNEYNNNSQQYSKIIEQHNNITKYYIII